MKTILFPHIFQLIGWIIFIPALILGGLIISNIMTLKGATETICNDMAIIGTALGALFITCSREVKEDEMTRAIRLSSLLNSIYIWTLSLITFTLTVNNLEYLNFMIVNLVLLPIIFVIQFKLEMHRYNKMSENEE